MGGCSSDPVGGVLLVSAASSLTGAFAEIEAAFEKMNPQVDVILNLGGSSALREAILEGAPVDVFAPADTSNMERVADAGGLAGEPTVFARNLLQIAVPSGNPANVSTLADFARDELLIGLCAADVPCGSLARQAFWAAGVTPAIDTNEPSVRGLLTKIEAGELDAGITYVTDVLSAERAVDGVDIPVDENIVASYPIGIMADAPNPETAEAFVAFVLSGVGGAILIRHGFSSP
ncbi:MAG: molybdate ABC transporter substrate-binding protein [Acidimicrobiia bacterium]